METVGDALALMWRDVAEVVGFGPVGWVFLAAVVGVPVASVWLGRRRKPLPVAAGAMWLAAVAEWFLYYATSWWANPGIVALWWFAAATLLAWVLLGSALLWDRRSDPHRTA